MENIQTEASLTEVIENFFEVLSSKYDHSIMWNPSLASISGLRLPLAELFEEKSETRKLVTLIRHKG
jgi:hypothetical protein